MSFFACKKGHVFFMCMKLLDLRKNLKKEFNQHDIDEVDVDFIISEVLGVKHTELILIDDVDDDAVAEIMGKVKLRLNNVPVDKIFKKSYFYGLDLVINDNVLSPRADSEILVETAIKYIKENQYSSVLDLCTGSGCLAIAVKKNVPDAEVSASDRYEKALSLAKKNAKRNGADINFIKSNMFENVTEKYDVIISNPPYIATDDLDELDEEVLRHDPHHALDGGEMGLKYFNIIHENAKQHLNNGGMLILEMDSMQKMLIQSLFTDFEFIECVKDYNWLDRVVVFKK